MLLELNVSDKVTELDVSDNFTRAGSTYYS